MAKNDLEDRLRPLNEKLSQWMGQRSVSGYPTYQMIPPENPREYLGVIDGFPARIDGDYTDNRYILWLDRIHKKHGYWSQFLTVEGTKFKFEPTPNFRINGVIEDSGTVNNFDFYFVKVDRR